MPRGRTRSLWPSTGGGAEWGGAVAEGVAAGGWGDSVAGAAAGGTRAAEALAPVGGAEAALVRGAVGAARRTAGGSLVAADEGVPAATSDDILLGYGDDPMDTEYE